MISWQVVALREQLALSTSHTISRPSSSYFNFAQVPFHARSYLVNIHYSFCFDFSSSIMRQCLLDSTSFAKTAPATGYAPCCSLRQRRLHQLRDPVT